MLLTDYIRLQSHPQVLTPNAQRLDLQTEQTEQKVDTNGNTFEESLKQRIAKGKSVEFTSHALKRIDSRGIDLDSTEKLERLNRGVQLAAEKGGENALIMIDNAAFVVSVKNNKVITTLPDSEAKNNVFTNIDSAVIV